MRLNSAGMVGIAVTSSPWAAGWKAIDINTRGLGLAGGTDAGAIAVNAYTDGTWRYKGTSGFGPTRLDFFDGVFTFLNAPAGAAGAAIAFVSAMQLTAAGNLGIGSVSPVVRVHASGPGAAARVRVQSTDASGVVAEFLSDGAVSAQIGTNTNHPFQIATNSTPRIFIRTTGHVDFLVGSGGFLMAGNPTRFATAGVLPPIGGQLITQAHGGVRPPDVWQWNLTCVIAEQGWAVGDVIKVSNNDISDPARQITMVANNANVMFLYSAAAGLALAIRPNNPAGNPVSITNANWRLAATGHWL
jgi:hypothetical protein